MSLGGPAPHHIIPFILLSTWQLLPLDCSYVSSIGSGTLPRAQDGMAVVYDAVNATFCLFGDADGSSPNQFVTFDGTTFTDIGVNWLPYGTGTYSQQYTVYNGNLWMISEDQSSFFRFNVKTWTVDNTISTPHNEDGDACLTSTDGYLLSVEDDTNVHIYDMNSLSWLVDVPSIPTVRRYGTACLVMDGTLYVIGGYLTSSQYDTIATLDVSTMSAIAQQSWDELSGTLTRAANGVGAVSYGTDIVVVGGEWTNGRSTHIHRIDTLTGSVELVGTLAIGVSYPACVVAGRTLYVFAGWSENRGAEDRWQTVDLPDLQATTTLRPTLRTSTTAHTNLSTEVASYVSTEDDVLTTLRDKVSTTAETRVDVLIVKQERDPSSGLSGDAVALLLVALITSSCCAMALMCFVCWKWFVKRKGRHIVSQVNPDPSPSEMERELDSVDELADMPATVEGNVFVNQAAGNRYGYSQSQSVDLWKHADGEAGNDGEGATTLCTPSNMQTAGQR